MYLVQWSDATGVYSQSFTEYKEAMVCLSELEANTMSCSMTTIDDPDPEPDLDDGSGWYWSNKERDYVDK